MRENSFEGSFKRGIIMSELENKGLENNSTPIDEGNNEPKTYTEEEVRKLLQQEGDRRVSQALKKQKAELDKQQAEADKLREMDENQRREYEFNKKVEELEQKEREFTIAQNKLEASKVMANRGLPVEFVDYIVAEDAETMMANIDAFDKAFKAAVADAVAKRIAQPTPKAGSAQQGGMTKEQFRKLNLAQQAEIYRTNPTLYKELTQ